MKSKITAPTKATTAQSIRYNWPSHGFKIHPPRKAPTMPTIRSPNIPPGPSPGTSLPARLDDPYDDPEQDMHLLNLYLSSSGCARTVNRIVLTRCRVPNASMVPSSSLGPLLSRSAGCGRHSPDMDGQSLDLSRLRTIPLADRVEHGGRGPICGAAPVLTVSQPGWTRCRSCSRDPNCGRWFRPL